jgi:hypothetical protein
MKTIAGVLIAAALAFGSGCARSDWIERTLVTVDVTGTWYGNVGGSGLSVRGVVFELEQQGSTVKGFVRFTGAGGPHVTSGPIDGTVAGDVFRFKDQRGGFEGEVTVSGDEMNGRASITGGREISLRRVDSSSRPGSPPR